MSAWRNMSDDAYDRIEARGEVSDDALGGYYESWRQDDDVVERLAAAIAEAAQLNAELADLIGLVA